MLTIKQRVATLRLCGQAARSPEVIKLMNETAAVLEALGTQYNRLHSAAKDAISRSNGADPAMMIIAQEIQNQSAPTPQTLSAKLN